MARSRERRDGRERERESVTERRGRSDLAIQQPEANVSETSHGTDRRLRFREEFLPDFLDLEFSDGVMPVLAMNLQHDGSGFVVESPGGDAGEPAGDLAEATTSTQSFSTVASYTVAADRTGRLEEISAQVQSDGEVRVVIDGQTFGSITGSATPALPFSGATLAAGTVVTVDHQSTDGTATTTRASITAREV
ncbi:MAG: hypothetical protein ABEH80_01945 [Halobaculum sp.]